MRQRKHSRKKAGGRPRNWRAIVLALFVCALACCVYFFLNRGHRLRHWLCEVTYPAGYDVHGIDISHYQGDIDWKELREHGTINSCPIRFVMIKATEGADQLDENFKRNFRLAREHGFTRGAYHFYSTHSSAAEQAKAFISNVTLERGDLPPVLDVEKKPKDKSTEVFRQDVLTWLRTVEKHYGVKPIIYTYYKFKMEYLDDSVFSQYPYWIAHYYVDKLEYRGAWKFWQHTDAGRLPGISGDVDFNVYNGSYNDLQQMTLR